MRLKILLLAIGLIFGIVNMYADSPNDDKTVRIPVSKDTGDGSSNKPKPTGLPVYDICDDVDCYWQDGVLYITFAMPEGNATAIVHRTSGIITRSFLTSEGAAISCGPRFDIERVEIHTAHAVYYSVGDDGYDIF